MTEDERTAVDGAKEDDPVDGDEFRIQDDKEPVGGHVIELVGRRLIHLDGPPERIMSLYGIEGGRYSLSRLDETAQSSLSSFRDSRPEDDEARRIISIVVDRAEWNGSYDVCTPENLERLFEENAPCAVIYMCNLLLDSLASILGITETDDTASYALCMLRAAKEGVFDSGELEDLERMFSYRDLCATRIEVFQPDQGSAARWMNLFFRTMAEMYSKASKRAFRS